MIIDIHAHTSKRLLHGLHVQHADIDDLHRWAKTFGIDRMYLQATYFPLKKTGLHNRDMLERITGDPLFGMFGSLNLEEDVEGGVEELRALAKRQLIDGIKLYLGYQCADLGDKRYWPVFQLAEEFSLPTACHTGELHHCCPKTEREQGTRRCGHGRCILDERGHLSHPERIRKAALAFPNVTFIASHLANPFFSELRSVMNECRNVYTDISGQFLSGSEDTPEYVQFIQDEIRSFLFLEGGIERVMFGTDFPIQSYASSLGMVWALRLKSSEEKLLLAENALRILPKRRGW